MLNTKNARGDLEYAKDVLWIDDQYRQSVESTYDDLVNYRVTPDEYQAGRVALAAVAAANMEGAHKRFLDRSGIKAS